MIAYPRARNVTGVLAPPIDPDVTPGWRPWPGLMVQGRARRQVSPVLGAYIGAAEINGQVFGLLRLADGAVQAVEAIWPAP